MLTHHKLSLAAAWALVAASLFTLPVQAAEDGLHEGKLVSLSFDTLVMTSGAQQEQRRLIAGARLTLDGKPCHSTDLKAGMRILVTTHAADVNSVLEIEALDASLNFADHQQEGKLVTLAGSKLVMTGANGSLNRACTLAADVKVTLDGKACGAADLKPGMRIRVTIQRGAPQETTQVEALDKHPKFAPR